MLTILWNCLLRVIAKNQELPLPWVKTFHVKFENLTGYNPRGRLAQFIETGAVFRCPN